MSLWQPETCRVKIKEINTQNKELHPLVTLLQYVSWQHLRPGTYWWQLVIATKFAYIVRYRATLNPPPTFPSFHYRLALKELVESLNLKRGLINMRDESFCDGLGEVMNFKVILNFDGNTISQICTVPCLSFLAVLLQQTYLTFRGPCIVIYSYNKSQRDALFLNFIW